MELGIPSILGIYIYIYIYNALAGQTCQRQAGSGVELPSRVGLEVLTAAVDRHWNQVIYIYYFIS